MLGQLIRDLEHGGDSSSRDTDDRRIGGSADTRITTRGAADCRDQRSHITSATDSQPPTAIAPIQITLIPMPSTPSTSALIHELTPDMPALTISTHFADH